MMSFVEREKERGGGKAFSPTLGVKSLIKRGVRVKEERVNPFKRGSIIQVSVSL